MFKIKLLSKIFKRKGLINIQNIKNNENKIKYIYKLTPKGITEKTKLTISFMKRKLNECDKLKKELDQDNQKNDYIRSINKI